MRPRDQCFLVGQTAPIAMAHVGLKDADPLLGMAGGWGGIRTHEPSRVGGFQDRCLKPLGHPSKAKKSGT